MSKRWTERHYRSNSFNVRKAIDYDMAIAPGKTRVTFRGDSFTNGHGIADVEGRRAASGDRPRVDVGRDWPRSFLPL